MYMKRKINLQLISIAVLAIIATVFMMSCIFYNLFQKQVKEDLQINAELLKKAAFSIPVEDKFFAGIRKLRITQIASDGTVLYDNDADIRMMDNHAGRPEVEQAFRQGTGSAVRCSDTLERSTFYYAILLDDGSVLRVAREANNIWSVFGSVVPVTGWIILAMMGISILLAHWLTKNLVRPIEKMAVNIDEGSIAPVYKELIPFINTIRAQHEDILKSAKMRQDFTANVSHELKTPLTAISGYAELMENGMVEADEIRHFSGEIHRNSLRLLSLINDIIRLSELDCMEEKVSFDTFNLYDVAQKCVETLKVNAEKHEVTIDCSGDNNLQIRANREMIVELVYNLCDNAIRYNNKNGRVSVLVTEKDGMKILEISDTGIGISPEHQERVFERFYRVDKSRSKQTGGTGLGLAIVKHIVALHHAAINLTSTPEKGTTIRVVF